MRDKDVLLRIYKTLIRPHLEYCVQVWNPVATHGNWGIILEIEGVQRRFTRLMNDIGTLPYSERLELLKLTTLAERRLRGDLIETFKIVNNLVEYGSSLFHVGRSGKNIIVRPDCNISSVRKLRNRFLSNRVVNYWNQLPVDIKLSESIDNFKINLENYKKSSNSLTGNYWEISYLILDKIEGSNYLNNKAKHNEYLESNPWVARKRYINLYKEPEKVQSN